MKITKKQLKQIIKEEIGRVMSEEDASGGNEVLAKAVVDSPEFKELSGGSVDDVKAEVAKELSPAVAEKLAEIALKAAGKGIKENNSEDEDSDHPSRYHPSPVGSLDGAILDAMEMTGGTAFAGMWAGAAAEVVNAIFNLGVPVGDLTTAFSAFGALLGAALSIGGSVEKEIVARKNIRDREEKYGKDPMDLEEVIRREIALALK